MDWLQELSRDLHGEIENLSPEALAWQPDPGANSVGVTVWHLSRWLDLLTVRACQDRLPEEELWHTRGWRHKTGYDPRGLGDRGFGAVTGYTLEEVRAIPCLNAQELLAYFDQVCEALHAYLSTLSSEALHQSVFGLGRKRTVYQWVKPVLIGCLGHMGEIQALKAMRERMLSQTSVS
jgi:hypothetical protein